MDKRVKLQVIIMTKSTCQQIVGSKDLEFVKCCKHFLTGHRSISTEMITVFPLPDQNGFFEVVFLQHASMAIIRNPFEMAHKMPTT